MRTVIVSCGNGSMIELLMFIYTSFNVVNMFKTRAKHVILDNLLQFCYLLLLSKGASVLVLYAYYLLSYIYILSYIYYIILVYIYI